MYVANFDLLAVGIVIAAMAALGFAAHFSDPRSATVRAFFNFSMVTSAWGIVNYLNYQFASSTLTLWLLRAVLFFATWQAFLLFRLFYVFPEREIKTPKWQTFFLLPIVVGISIMTLTSLVFPSIARLSAVGHPSATVVNPGIYLFGVVAVGLVAASFFILWKKLSARADIRRLGIIILAGSVITFGLVITFNFIIAGIFLNVTYLPLGALFMFPLVASVAYAILREHLFNIKVIATTALVFVLSITSIIDIIFSNTLPEVLLRVGVFVLVLVFGINLIRGVLREVEQREEIQKLAEELEETNKRQEGLIHFVGHEVKGFLTKAAGVFSMLDEGELGALPEGMKPFIDRALEDTRHGVSSVSDILKASNMKKGTVNYTKVPFDLKAAAAESVERAKQNAEQKGLMLSFTADDGDFTYNGDRGEILDHVFRNLVDNAVNYTPSGSIQVSLRRAEGPSTELGTSTYVFAVKDSGVGITDEDKKHLFTEGGHGKESQKVNVNSTGYGLFIAKQVTESHGGTIRADSAGTGKGSVFTVEFPMT